MAENSLKAQKPRITQKQQKSRLRRFYFLLLTAVLFAAGAQAGELFHVEERLYDAAGEEDIRETLAAGGDKKETKPRYMPPESRWAYTSKPGAFWFWESRM